MFKKFLIFAIFLDFSALSQSGFEIELVESIPAETTLDNPDICNTQEVWLEMINSAQKTLDIEQFYITNEECEPLDTVLKAIIAAANRGVNVRIIIDSEMYNTYPADARWLDAESYNIETRVIDIKSLTGGVQHAKFFIVDGGQVFLGSQNFDWRSLKHIHELGVRIVDQGLCEFYNNIFEHDYFIAKYNDLKDTIYLHSRYYVYRDSKEELYTFYPTYSSHVLASYYRIWGIAFTDLSELNLDSNAQDIKRILTLINYSKSEINLQFLSYNVNYKGEYWSEVDSALINAAARGVKVKLIVSDWNLGKTAVEHFKFLITHPDIEIKYTAIPEYSGGYISYSRVDHCKFITADSVCWIGTSNMSKDYFYSSRNVGVVIENGKFTQRVRDIFYKSWDSEYAHKIEPEGVYEVRKHGE